METLITRVTKIYHNCNDCPSLLKPDVNGRVKLFNKDNGEESTLIISKKKYNRNMELIPNPCIGFCDRLGKKINNAEFPIRVTDKTGLPEMESAFHTHDGKCILEHHVSEDRSQTF